MSVNNGAKQTCILMYKRIIFLRIKLFKHVTGEVWIVASIFSLHRLDIISLYMTWNAVAHMIPFPSPIISNLGNEQRPVHVCSPEWLSGIGPPSRSPLVARFPAASLLAPSKHTSASISVSQTSKGYEYCILRGGEAVCAAHCLHLLYLQMYYVTGITRTRH